MKTLFLKDSFKYDGTQLRTLYAYLKHEVLGDSAVAWIGPCEIDFKHIVDGEDRLANSKICGDKMAHFILEVFHQSLFSGVILQRLMASIVVDVLRELSSQNDLISHLARRGDDIFVEDRKHSISIATCSAQSVMIHFAVNVTNDKTPVKTVGLEDFNISAKVFVEEVLQRLSKEIIFIKKATCKTLPVTAFCDGV